MVWLWVLLAFALTPVLGGTFWALATEGRRNHPKWGVFRSVQYAHRGLHNRELGVPENSMAAFRRARELGYGVELDVHLTKDGQLAVIHDKSLKRTAGVDAEVSDLTMEELKRCRLEGTQETVPALEEAARLFQGGPPLLVELKADYTAPAGGEGEAVADANDLTPMMQMDKLEAGSEPAFPVLGYFSLRPKEGDARLDSQHNAFCYIIKDGESVTMQLGVFCDQALLDAKDLYLEVNAVPAPPDGGTVGGDTVRRMFDLTGES